MSTVEDRTATLQVFQEPAPFVLQLSVGGGSAPDGNITAELGAIEPAISRLHLRENHGKVAVDGGANDLVRCLQEPEVRSTAVRPGRARVQRS